MRFHKLINKNYLHDKKSGIVHDLLAIDSDKNFVSKIVHECHEEIKKIKFWNRKHLTFNQFIASWAKGEVEGCSKCLPGFKKK